MNFSRWMSGDRQAPAPLEGNIVATVTGLTILWFVLFLVQLPFYGWFADHDRTWWLWTCLAGAGLGLYGIWFVRKREAALRRSRTEQKATSQTERRADPGAGQQAEPEAEREPGKLTDAEAEPEPGGSTAPGPSPAREPQPGSPPGHERRGPDTP